MGINKRLLIPQDSGVVNTENFAPVTYTTNGGTQSISSLDFQPDFVWIKRRDGAGSHYIFDSVRGVYKALITEQTYAEINNSTYLTSFDSNGFSLGTNSALVGSGNDYVAWCWKAGGAEVSNTDGSITSQVSANPDAGFSIVSWNGTGSNETIGHGLNLAPELIITKTRGSGIDNNWNTFTTIIDGSYDYLRLNTPAAKGNSGLPAPTSSVFSYGTETVDIIAYCFHSVDGYQKVGSYTGTGATGNFQDCGFEPSFIIIKRTDGTDAWIMLDNKRSPSNPRDEVLLPNGSDLEYPNNIASADFNSNGFTLNTTSTNTNGSGQTYIYLAIA